jgi:hypothetical protein
MEKLAQAGQGGGVHAHPLSLKQLSEQIHSPYFIYTNICILCGNKSAKLSLQSSELAPPAPSPTSECCHPPLVSGGGTHSLAGERAGRSQFGQRDRHSGTLVLYNPSTRKALSGWENCKAFHCLLHFTLLFLFKHNPA